jgi:hypothetical protein
MLAQFAATTFFTVKLSPGTSGNWSKIYNFNYLYQAMLDVRSKAHTQLSKAQTPHGSLISHTTLIMLKNGSKRKWNQIQVLQISYDLSLTIWSSFLIGRISFDENKKNPFFSNEQRESKFKWKERWKRMRWPFWKRGEDETSSRLNNLYLWEKEKAFVQK